jgi:hypothetical protein
MKDLNPGTWWSIILIVFKRGILCASCLVRAILLLTGNLPQLQGSLYKTAIKTNQRPQLNANEMCPKAKSTKTLYLYIPGLCEAQ